jgi:O-antigen/teichoic acid export membrane protein
MAAAILAFPTAVLLARFLGAEEYGKYAYALAWASLLVRPAVLGMDTYLVAVVARYNARADWGRLRAVLRWARRRVLYVASVVSILALTVAVLFVPSELRIPLCIALTLIPVTALTTVRQGALQGFGHVTAAFIPERLLFPSLFLLLVSTVGFSSALKMDAVAAVVMNVISACVAFAVGATLLHRRTPRAVKDAIPIEERSQWTGAALSVTLFGLVGVGGNYVGVLLLGSLGNPDDAAIFQVASRVTDIIGFALAAINAPLAPMVARLYELGDGARLQHVTTRAAQACFVLALVMSVGLLLGRGFIMDLFGAGFEEGTDVLVILTVSQLIHAAMGPVGILLLMTRHEGKASLVGLVGFLVNIGVSAALIPALGAAGAAVGSAASVATWNVVLGLVTKRVLGINATVFGVPWKLSSREEK